MAASLMAGTAAEAVRCFSDFFFFFAIRSLFFAINIFFFLTMRSFSFLTMKSFSFWTIRSFSFLTVTFKRSFLMMECIFDEHYHHYLHGPGGGGQGQVDGQLV